jgi:hypothetical protein
VGLGIWTQGFMFAKQMWYHLSHISSPFCSGYFADQSQELFPWAGFEP